MPTKQQIYKKNARYLSKMNKYDREFSKFILTVGYPTVKQQNNEVYDKLNRTNEFKGSSKND